MYIIGENMSVAIQILKKLAEAAVEGKTPTKEEMLEFLKTAQEAAIKARQELSRRVREFWSSDEGQIVRFVLEWEAYESGWANEMERIMKQHERELEEIAKKLNLSARYRMVWGKPPKPG